MSGRTITDTTEFCDIDYGDIIKIGDRRYAVLRNEQERRFGMDDPKFWVKRCKDLDTGEKKILKLTFLETFKITIGGVSIRCFRNPKKEEEILRLVNDHPYFMHGTAFRDEKGNNVRVLDIVPGRNFFSYIDSLSMGYEIYFNTLLPDILKKLVNAFEAIRFLHLNQYRHGDIRNDHIIVERDTGNYVWIDFDYDFDAAENPFSLDIFGMGNILLYAAGKGFHNLHMIVNDRMIYGDLLDRLDPGDFSLLDKWRLVNLQKLYPYFPTPLNDILMHFAAGASMYYETTDEIIEDLARSISLISR